MNTSWWVSKDELDETQLAFINLSAQGRYQLEGPAGSGKTNLLLLRAQFVAGQGDKNVLVITFTRSLSRFLRSGLVASGLMEPDQVRTFHSWARRHVKLYLNEDIVAAGHDFDEVVRAKTVELLRKANEKAPTKKLINSLFIDEAQDLTAAEISCLADIAENVCVCGDLKQGIYHRDGLKAAEELNLTKFTLTNHYRIGHRIAHVADRLLPPVSVVDSLEATSNYNEKKLGKSTAELHRLSSREAQFQKMLEILNIQVSAYAGDRIGILCGLRTTAEEVYALLSTSELAPLACSHLIDGTDFSTDAQIHVMTMHSSKGIEFRAVHLFGIEELRGIYMNNPTLAYTAVTRAKTALNAYCTGATSAELEHAFSVKKHIEIDALFPSKN
ncbi:UvrD-helicase domain-containing protein [Xanthomonas axonopodis pv. poinsettiicola]|uniref:UvrD-helicase domain-containing protein n=1 Tax=Xanthomonas TaxID=338 RepID=UPI001E4DD62E|nr:UvrD-helicase domain-containing protein [Xanthomonas codiaei]MCC8536052.1 AAA family ATPase [Xanthomonas codiaei]